MRTDRRLQVEAMSNIGASAWSLGRVEEAQQWWFKALQLRPLFWDAIVGYLDYV